MLLVTALHGIQTQHTATSIGLPAVSGDILRMCTLYATLAGFHTLARRSGSGALGDSIAWKANTTHCYLYRAAGPKRRHARRYCFPVCEAYVCRAEALENVTKSNDASLSRDIAFPGVCSI